MNNELNKKRILEIMGEHDVDYPEACMMLIDEEEEARPDRYEDIANTMVYLAMSLYGKEIEKYFSPEVSHLRACLMVDDEEIPF